VLGNDPQPLGERLRRQRLLRVHEPLHGDADEQGVQDRAGLARRLGVLGRVDPQEELRQPIGRVALDAGKERAQLLAALHRPQQF
jgi:hypothetical protein